MKKYLKLLAFSFLLIMFFGCQNETDKGEKNHSFGEWSISVEPTCTETGIKKHTCTGCGYVETEIIAAKGHSYDDGTITKNATCTENGEKKYTCTTCNDHKVESIPANGHSYDNGTITKNATCTENGEKTYTCTVCNSSKVESVLATGHNYDGIKCSVCGSYSVTLSEVGKEYTDSDGLTLVLNSFNHTESNGYNNYSINYALTNSIQGSEISPGIFKIIYKTSDGNYDSSFQTGAFNKLYYNGTITRSYSWKLTSDKSFVCIEYMSDSQMSSYIFSSTPSDNLLNWITD